MCVATDFNCARKVIRPYSCVSFFVTHIWEISQDVFTAANETV